jgi:hypothetical protein
MSDRHNQMTRKSDVVAMLRRLAAPVSAKQENALPRYEVELELRRHQQALEAQRQAEQEAPRAPEPIVDIVRAALFGNAPAKEDSSAVTAASATTALNSAALLRAALGGSAGTINGHSGSSALRAHGYAGSDGE